MLNWQYYPKSDSPPSLVLQVVTAFEGIHAEIDSNSHTMESNAVLAIVSPSLAAIGFTVETSKSAEGKVRVPVLFGRNGRMEKSFDADAFHRNAGFVLEVEAGRAFTNNQFLKDLFQACMMHDVVYLGIAVRNIYRQSQDFEKIVRFFDTMFASNRLTLPLKGIVIIGY